MEIIQITEVEALHQAMALRADVFIAEQGVAPELEIDKYDQLYGGAVHVLMLDDTKQAVATGRYIDYHQQAKLQRICVAKAYRGKGLGEQVMAFLEALAKEQGYKEATLGAQVQAQGFYERLGYRLASDEVFLDAGIEHITMVKTL